MNKRRKKYIKKHYTFYRTHSYPEKDFKSKMKASGQMYASDINILSFPSYIANLLKWKKHEWIVLAFVKDDTVECFYANKGEDNESVSLNVNLGYMISYCEENGYQTLMRFHNHPNSDPYHTTRLLASKQDKESAKKLGEIALNHNINWLDFVCERGRFIEFARYFSDSFYPTECSYWYISDENNDPYNFYRLQRELGFGRFFMGSSSIQKENGISNITGSDMIRRNSSSSNSGAIGAVIGIAAIVIVCFLLHDSADKNDKTDNVKNESASTTTVLTQTVTQQAYPTIADNDELTESLEIQLIITAKNANIRKGPSSKTDVVTTAKRDTEFIGTGKTEKADNGGLWYEIYLDESKTETAWASEQVIKLKE